MLLPSVAPCLCDFPFSPNALLGDIDVSLVLPLQRTWASNPMPYASARKLHDLYRCSIDFALTTEEARQLIPCSGLVG